MVCGGSQVPTSSTKGRGDGKRAFGTAVPALTQWMWISKQILRMPQLRNRFSTGQSQSICYKLFLKPRDKGIKLVFIADGSMYPSIFPCIFSIYIYILKLSVTTWRFQITAYSHTQRACISTESGLGCYHAGHSQCTTSWRPLSQAWPHVPFAADLRGRHF